MKLWSVLVGRADGGGHMSRPTPQRMGGGESVGQQSSNVTQRESAGGSPSQERAAHNQRSRCQPATPAAAPPLLRPAPLGRHAGWLAAGLGLAWLASSLGLGAGFAQFLLIALLALAVVAVIGMVMRARRAGAANAVGAPRLSPSRALAHPPLRRRRCLTPTRPENVGNDASARPWERNSMAFDASRPAQAFGRGDWFWPGRLAKLGAYQQALTPRASCLPPSATSWPCRQPGIARTSPPCVP